MHIRSKKSQSDAQHYQSASKMRAAETMVVKKATRPKPRLQTDLRVDRRPAFAAGLFGATNWMRAPLLTFSALAT